MFKNQTSFDAISRPAGDAGPMPADEAAADRRDPPVAGGRRRWRRAAGVAAALLVIGGLAAGGAVALRAGAPVPAAGAEAPSPLPVAAVAAPMEAGYTITRRFTGRVVARRIAVAGFETGGLVEAVRVDDGDRVAAGDVLARLDTRILSADRDRLVAERARVAARLDLAEVTTARRAALAAAGHSSAQAYDDARFEAAALAAELESVDAAIAAIDVSLDKAVLRAPFPGHVTARAVDDGTVVAAGQPVMEIVEDARPEVRVAVPAAFAATLAAGDPVRLELLGRPETGTVTAVLPDLSRATRTVTVLVRPDDAVAAPSGEIARMLVERRVDTAGHWVPLSALAEGTRGLWTVYALQPDEADPDTYRVERALVEVLHPEAERVFVRGTLAADALILADGPHRVVPGQRVRLAAGPPVDRRVADAGPPDHDPPANGSLASGPRDAR